MKQNTNKTEDKWKPSEAIKQGIVKPRPVRPMTRKEAAFTRELIQNPKQSATQAALKTYDTDNPVTAASIAHENLRKPQVMAELAKHSGTAEITLIEVMEKSRERMQEDKPRAVDWANTARQTADSILDRLHGKATIKTESTSLAVTLAIDLTGTVDTPENK